MTILLNTIEALSKRKNVHSGSEAVEYCGANTGNVCFADAVRDQIKFDSEIGWGELEQCGQGTLLVIPASNWIRINNQKIVNDLFFSLEQRNIQCLVLGIGIQFDLKTKIESFSSELKKDKEQVRALKILSEHSAYIGVRGNITGECLDKIGIHNWKAIGCPSFYEPYRKYGKINVKESSYHHVAINMTPVPENYGEYKIIQMGMKNQWDIILQMMSDMPLALWEERDITKKHIRQRFAGGVELDPCELKKYIHNCGHIFYTRAAWTEYLLKKGIDLVIGSRFHGGMMALSNQIPALWVMHDMRTKEMIEVMKLPYITYEDVMRCSEYDLYDKCEYGEKFYKNYMEMSRNYVAMLNACGVGHNLALL